MIDGHTLGAAANKLRALPDKVLGDISKLLEGLRHDCEEEKSIRRLKRGIEKEKTWT